MKLGDAPTHSYREMNQKVFEQDDLRQVLSDLDGAMGVEDQVGIVCLWGSKILGLELYGSPRIWTEVGEEVLKGYLLDRYFLDEQPRNTIDDLDLPSLLDTEVASMITSRDEAAGDGELYSLSNNEWEGMTLLLGDEPVHFIAARQHVKLGRENGSQQIYRPQMDEEMDFGDEDE